MIFSSSCQHRIFRIFLIIHSFMHGFNSLIFGSDLPALFCDRWYEMVRKCYLLINLRCRSCWSKTYRKQAKYGASFCKRRTNCQWQLMSPFILLATIATLGRVRSFNGYIFIWPFYNSRFLKKRPDAVNLQLILIILSSFIGAIDIVYYY